MTDKGKLKEPIVKEIPKKYYVMENLLKNESPIKKEKGGGGGRNKAYPFSIVFSNPNLWITDPENWNVILQKNNPSILVDKYTDQIIKSGNYEVKITKKGNISSIDEILISKYAGTTIKLTGTNCYYCGKPNPPYVCSRCYFARYCTDKCQKADYRNSHLKDCVKLIIIKPITELKKNPWLS